MKLKKSTEDGGADVQGEVATPKARGGRKRKATANGDELDAADLDAADTTDEKQSPAAKKRGGKAKGVGVKKEGKVKMENADDGEDEAEVEAGAGADDEYVDCLFDIVTWRLRLLLTSLSSIAASWLRSSFPYPSSSPLPGSPARVEGRS